MTKRKPERPGQGNAAKRSETGWSGGIVDAAWWQAWPALVLTSGFLILEAIVYAWRGRKNIRNEAWQEAGV